MGVYYRLTLKDITKLFTCTNPNPCKNPASIGYYHLYFHRSSDIVSYMRFFSNKWKCQQQPLSASNSKALAPSTMPNFLIQKEIKVLMRRSGEVKIRSNDLNSSLFFYTEEHCVLEDGIIKS